MKTLVISTCLGFVVGFLWHMANVFYNLDDRIPFGLFGAIPIILILVFAFIGLPKGETKSAVQKKQFFSVAGYFIGMLVALAINQNFQ